MSIVAGTPSSKDEQPLQHMEGLFIESGKLPSVNCAERGLDALCGKAGAERGQWDGQHRGGATYVYTLTREQLQAIIEAVYLEGCKDGVQQEIEYNRYV